MLLHPRAALALVLVSLVGLVACAGDDGGTVGPDAGPTVTPDAPDPSDELFAPDHLLEIAIELPEAAWDTLRMQNRSADTLIGADCQAAPFPNPFTEQVATVTVDGVRLEQVGIRKKGFLGSLDDDKPSLKLDLDQTVPGQNVAGLRGLTLNNNKQDPSALRQCLAYQLFTAAGVPAPRCNFAHVTVNGRELGVYTHVEAVGKRMLARHFASNDGRLYEGTLSDFRPGWMATFEPKTDEANPDRSELEDLAAALTAPDDQLLARLAPLLDVDRFINFWAMETLIEHWDGYANNTNNFFIYRDPSTGLIDFLPWGTDGVMAAPGADPPSQVVLAEGLLTRRLYLLPETRTRYVARMQALLDQIWDEAALTTELDRMRALIAAPLAVDVFAPRADAAVAQADVRAFLTSRAERVAPVLAAPPAWTQPLRTSFCFVDLGPVAATFSTTFKNAEPPDFFAAGTGTLTGSISGVPITTTRLGSNAAPGEDGRVAVQLIGLVSATEVIVAVVNLRPDQVVAGGSAPIEVFSSYLFRFDPTTGAGEVIGFLLGGTIQFTAGGTTEGAPVVGSFSSRLFSVPF